MALNKLFDIDATIKTLQDEGSDIDPFSTTEETLERIHILRGAVASIFGKSAAFEHEFFDTPQESYGDRTPHRMACEGSEGLIKALQALKAIDP